MHEARIPAALLLLLAVTGCDGLLGPSDTPASIVVEAERTEFDFVGETARLEAEVRNEDGDILGSPSVSWRSRNASVAMVDETGVVTGRANGDVWVIGQAGGVKDSVRFTVQSPVPCLPVGTLTVPDTVAEDLEPGECGPEARYTEVWAIVVQQGGLITLDLVSTDFNTFLVLLDSQGRLIATDNNSGLGFNARLLVNVPPGTYYALARPFTEGFTGRYELSVIQGTHPTPCPPSATVAFPDTVAGSTGTDACVYEGFHFDVYRLDLAANANVIFEVSSQERGMFMAVTDTLGLFLFGGFEGPLDGTWLEQTLLPGPYDIWVAAEEQGVTVDYTLQIKEGPAALACPATGAVSLNGIANGTLSDDACWAWYAPSDGWTLDITDTTDVTIAVNTPESIYPALLMSDSAGSLVGVGFDGLTRYARHDTTLVPGSYRIWVQSADLEPAPGDYQLSVVEADQMGACEPLDTAVMDSTFEGALSTTDCALIDGRYTDGWTLQIDAPTRAAIDLTTDKFDAFLIVVDSAGETVGRDDDSGSGTDATLTLDLEPGAYTVWATSYAPQSIGGYQLALATAAAGFLADGDGGQGKKTEWDWPPGRTGRDTGTREPIDLRSWLRGR